MLTLNKLKQLNNTEVVSDYKVSIELQNSGYKLTVWYYINGNKQKSEAFSTHLSTLLNKIPKDVYEVEFNSNEHLRKSVYDQWYFYQLPNRT